MKFTKSNCRIPSVSRAFTLVEVMTALMVFVVIVLIFGTSLPVTRQTSRMNGQYTQAASLCQHKIDQLRGMGYGKLTYTSLKSSGVIDASPTASPFSFTTTDGVASILPNPTTEVRIVDLPASEAPTANVSVAAGTRRVTVTIRWKKTTFETKTSEMSLTALISQQ